jgi:ADP-ribose pyrophosphatase YjhB (NUDIX family)
MDRRYKFCPLCGEALAAADEGPYPRMRCGRCGFIQYMNPSPAAGVLVRDGEGRVLLVQRRFEPFEGFWVIPSGYIEHGEDVMSTAVRELEEETGLKVEIDGIHAVESCFDDPRGDTLLTIFLGHVSGGRLRAGDDAANAGFFAPDDLPPIGFDCQKRILSRLS